MKYGREKEIMGGKHLHSLAYMDDYPLFGNCLFEPEQVHTEMI